MDDDSDPLGRGEERPARPAGQDRLPDATRAHHRAQAPDLLERRLERIRDGLDRALSSPLAEIAVIGGVSADLAVFELRLSQSIEGLLAECQATREYLDALPEGLEMMLKLSRQLERNTRLAQELARAKG